MCTPSGLSTAACGEDHGEQQANLGTFAGMFFHPETGQLEKWVRGAAKLFLHPLIKFDLNYRMKKGREPSRDQFKDFRFQVAFDTIKPECQKVRVGIGTQTDEEVVLPSWRLEVPEDSLSYCVAQRDPRSGGGPNSVL